MISQFFMMSLSNFIQAAMNDVLRHVPADAPVKVTFGSHAPAGQAGEREGYIKVTSPSGFEREILVDDNAVAACNQAEDGRAASQELVDQLAAELRSAVSDALELERTRG